MFSGTAQDFCGQRDAAAFFDANFFFRAPAKFFFLYVGSLQNVQGRNPVADLAQALAPLAKLADTGLQMYASGEYKKGQNEVLKASALLNRQMLASGQEYAAQNRDLSRVDPVAAVVMDNGNPYRVAGRKNQASQLAAQALPGAMNQLWAENGSELVKLDLFPKEQLIEMQEPSIRLLLLLMTTRIKSVKRLKVFPFILPILWKSF